MLRDSKYEIHHIIPTVFIQSVTSNEFGHGRPLIMISHVINMGFISYMMTSCNYF